METRWTYSNPKYAAEEARDLNPEFDKVKWNHLFNPLSECDEPLSHAQMEAIKHHVYQRANWMRKKCTWSREEEAAFLNGAIACFFACGNNGDIPKWWMLTSYDHHIPSGKLKVKRMFDYLLEFFFAGKFTK